MSLNGTNRKKKLNSIIVKSKKFTLAIMMAICGTASTKTGILEIYQGELVGIFNA